MEQWVAPATAATPSYRCVDKPAAEGNQGERTDFRHQPFVRERGHHRSLPPNRPPEGGTSTRAATTATRHSPGRATSSAAHGPDRGQRPSAAPLPSCGCPGADGAPETWTGAAKPSDVGAAPITSCHLPAMIHCGSTEAMGCCAQYVLPQRAALRSLGGWDRGQRGWVAAFADKNDPKPCPLLVAWF